MTYTRTLEDFTPPKRFDDLPFTSVNFQEAALSDGPWVTLENIPISDPDADPTAPATRSFTSALATLAAGWYRIEWVDDTASVFDSDPVRFPAPSARLATLADVATRLGRALSDAEDDQVDILLGTATAMILEAGGRGDAWLEAQDTVSGVLRGICIEVVCRAMANPVGAQATSEQLGAYQVNRSYGANGAGGLLLTGTERLLASRAINGSNAGTAQLQESVFEDLDPGVPTTAWQPQAGDPPEQDPPLGWG